MFSNVELPTPPPDLVAAVELAELELAAWRDRHVNHAAYSERQMHQREKERRALVAVHAEALTKLAKWKIAAYRPELVALKAGIPELEADFRAAEQALRAEQRRCALVANCIDAARDDLERADAALKSVAPIRENARVPAHQVFA